MSQSLRRVVFIKDADLHQGSALRPLVIPALLQLKSAGFNLVVESAHPVSEVVNSVLSLLKDQGLNFLSLHPASALQQRPNIAAYRDLLGGDSLDLQRSAVIGSGDVDAAFAANLGIHLRSLDDSPDAWLSLATELVKQPRIAMVRRKTSETDIAVSVNLDADSADSAISTGIGFFDHMLAQLARHGGIQMQISVKGDLHIDEHHTVEDTALALGQALRTALGDRFGIERYAFVLPMDESLVTVALDLSGRPHLQWVANFPRAEVGGLPTELVQHFFRSLCESLGATLHVEVRGDNAHHMVEGTFKAVARCLRLAVRQTSDGGVPSTKGVL